jgi:hypothetical protein
MSQYTNSTSIIGCFEEDLPELGQGEALYYKSVSSSSVTTQNAQPPKVLIHTAAKKYETIAKVFLAKTYTQTSHLGKMSIYEACPEIQLDSEGGVVAGSMGYIIMPIIQLLRLQYGGQFQVSIETSHFEYVQGEGEGEGERT